ncbi:P-loop containing nucleoside triphosphate hydrolase protein [Cadophora sp. MPI-SDFR-AT-0126]|nr:P-loop containing nucleoside triphosphate hydrolase protein [Leotiomycetes sp. MPI-SDFR-AT-0126]
MSTRRSDRKIKGMTQEPRCLTSDPFAALDEPINQPPMTQGSKCELHTYDSRQNNRGETIIIQSSRRSEFFQHQADGSEEAALTLVRYFSSPHEVRSKRLFIWSPHIKRALKEVVQEYPGVDVKTNGPIIIVDDPWVFFHYREELRAYESKMKNKQAKEHVRFCLQYMEKSFEREISNYEVKVQNPTVAPGLEFQDLWMIFKPSVLLYQKTKCGEMMCRIISMTKYVDIHEIERWRSVIEVLSAEGKGLRYTLKSSYIDHYHGYKPFTDLSIFPITKHPARSAIEKRLSERGLKYISLLGQHHCMYNGIADSQSDEDRSNLSKGRVMIDSKMMDVEDDDDHIGFAPFKPAIRPILGSETNISEEDLLICGFTLIAWHFVRKTWECYPVAGLELVKYNEDAFQSLVLPCEMKRTLASLVGLQNKQSRHFDDLIDGKGKGLIILLHGPPGVGKTFTAESIAEFAKRPLYTLGSHEFDDPSDLVMALNRALRWNAIVLMDEADVFMQERGLHELNRNEKVSTLLRHLEYFEGTMFLTTNRVETIDSAFKSRIHLALTYPNLSPASRKGLWEMLILKGTDQRRPRWLTGKLLDTISKENVNGREIKNIVRVAHALAVDEDRSMKPEDLLLGLRARNAFERDFEKAGAKRQLAEEEPPRKRSRAGEQHTVDDHY